MEREIQKESYKKQKGTKEKWMIMLKRVMME